MHSPSFQLVYHPYDSFHASVVISKKVSRGAVERNKMRRRIYDCLRRHGRAGTLSGVFIVIAKQGAAKLPYHELSQELVDMIGRALNKR